ncbi:hypothetical protein [Natrinema marinum]|uniref:hypothetical protein n=1 Tax=Natrinema marinum TaxID=2961598 RepID=UPI0020C8D1A3|nr:hypothetical protein [Natrinema marinum]
MEWNDDETEVTFEMARGGPHVSRLTPTLSGGSGLLSGEVELEGWVTSAAVMATDYNSSRSNRPRTRSSDDDSDGDGVSDADEDAALLAYLEGKPIVGERFTVCLPDAEVPGGAGSIAEEVTPERFIEYVTGQSDGGGRVYAWGDSKATWDGAGDCDDSDASVYPGAVCGTSPHLAADITGPTATGGSLQIVRGSDEMVAVINRPSETGGGPAKVCAAVADDDPCGPGVWARTSGGEDPSADILAPTFTVAQVMVQPPECPHPFPALLYVQQCRSDDQLVYTGGWVLDEAALYENSVTVLSMAGATPVVPVGHDAIGDDGDGDGIGDLVERSVSGERGRRGARIDSGTVDELVESEVLSSGVAGGIRKRPGKRTYDIELKHVAVDAPVLHVESASRASRDVKFKAGAELSKAVN